MLSKIALICLIITLQVFTTESQYIPMSKVLCLRPAFNSITKMFDNKYFMSDSFGNYFNDLTDESVFEDIDEMNQLKGKPIEGIRDKDNKRFNDYYPEFNAFDLTFKVNFDSKCEFVSEKVYGIKHLKNQSSVYTFYSEHKWISPILLSNNTPDLDSKFFAEGLKLLKPNERVKAVLNFELNGILFIQGNEMVYVSCDGSLGWKLYTGKVQNDLIVFNDNYNLFLGDIFGGYVDNENSKLFLFSGQLSSSGKMVRKYLHSCEYQFKKGRKPSKIEMSCTKVSLIKYCQKGFTFSWFHKTIAWILFAIIFVILISLIICCICCREPKPVVTPKKVNTVKGLSRVRGIGHQKPTLARKRTS